VALTKSLKFRPFVNFKKWQAIVKKEGLKYKRHDLKKLEEYKNNPTHIWHTDKPPQYPQWIQFQYSRPQTLHKISISSQTGKPEFAKRAPKHFIFQASNDERSWTDLIEVKNAGFTSEQTWRTFEFENNKEYTFYRIYILANGGDPSLLTIQQVALN